MTVSLEPKGATFTRIAIAKAVGRGDDLAAAEIAAARWGEGSQPARILRAAVTPGSTDDGSWAGTLKDEYSRAVAEFMTLVRNQSIIGRLSGLRRLPARVPVLLQTGGAVAHWVAEGRPMPISNMGFARSTVDTNKLAAVCVVTDDLLRAGDPSTEATIRGDLVRAVTDASDLAFIDPENDGEEGVSPAAVTNGATAIAATGGDDDDLRADVKRLVATFEGDLTAAYFVGRPELFVQMNGPAFPNIGARGGEIAGIPAIASRTAALGDGDDNTLALIDPTGIVFAADDADAQINISRQGSIQMSDTPDFPATASTVLFSLWQENLTAIAAILRESWSVKRAGSVALLTDVPPVGSA